MERRELVSIIGVSFMAALMVAGAADSFINRIPTYSLEHDAALKSPYKYRPQLNASMRFIKQKQYAFALAYAQSATRIKPDQASGWINAATASAALQAWPLAEQYLKMALAICPSRDLAENLIFTYGMQGKQKEADELEKRLPEFPPGLPLDEPTD